MRMIVPTVCCVLSSFSAHYTIVSLQPASAEILFRFDNGDLKKDPPETALLFAVPSQPGIAVTATVSKTNGIACSRNVLAPLSGGWMGNRFLQWFSLTVQADNTASLKTGVRGGTLVFSYSKPIVKTVATGATTSTRHGIIGIPVTTLSRKRAAVTKPPLPFTIGVRMDVSQDGIYHITGSDLTHCGVPIDKIPLNSYRLFCKNTEIPLYVSHPQHTRLAESDVLQFYGKQLRGDTHYYTQYSYTNIYWLTWGGTIPGVRVAEASGALKKDPFNYNPDLILKAKEFTDTLHCEYDTDILWLGDVFSIEQTGNTPVTEADVDNWYWGGIGTKKVSSFTYQIPSPVSNTTFSLTLALTGLSSINTVQNDHQYSVIFNDEDISARAIWDGQNDYELVIHNIPSRLLFHGQNELTLLRSQSDTIPDRGALNWFEIIYTKGFTALDDRITFQNNPKDTNKWVQFDLSKFTTNELELWDITKHRKFKDFTIEKISRFYTLSFQDSITTPTHYYAQATELRLKPEYMTLDTIRDDWEFPLGVDYIIITWQYLMELLDPLIEEHTQEGLRVAVIDLQDIYNRFSYGIRNPESIRTILHYLYAMHIHDPPQYLLLAGDASHDMDKNPPRMSANIVPTHLTRVPNWGPSANDDYFATVYGEDNFPDLYVGRFPVLNEMDMQTCVEKTVNYLRNLEHGYWRDNLVLAGGYEPDFTTLNNEIVSEIVGPKMHIFRMDADPESPFYTSGTGASDKLAGYINAGAYAIHFTGHGGGNTWSDSKFFSYTDLAKLHNSQWSISGRLPIVFSFTCLTGFFESNLYSSLGEEFLRKSADGCIAFYGASAYTRRDIDIQMSRQIVTNAMTYSFESLGELIHLTEMQMLVRNASEAIPLTRQYNLLGDPALPWKLTPDTLSFTLSSINLKETDTLGVSGTAAPIVSGNAKLSVSAENNVSWGERIIPVSNGTFHHTFSLKSAARTAHGLVRAYVWNDSSELMGWQYFAKDTFALSEVTIAPSEPALGDSISISCRMASRDTAYNPTIRCMYTIDNPQSQNITFGPNDFVAMIMDSATGLWHSQRKIAVGSPAMPFDVNKYLIIQFRATGTLGASDYYSFKLRGRPDLIFTGDSLSIAWRNDSLSIAAEVLNKGNAVSPPFSVAFYSQNFNDTIVNTYITDSLYPGNTVDMYFSIPDTQGNMLYTGILNGDSTIEEILYTNNLTTVFFKATYADLHTPADTLSSLRDGCILIPADTFSITHRVFLFSDTLRAMQPLPSTSAWMPLAGDGFSCFYAAARPALPVSDSLLWEFTGNEIPDSGINTGVFLYDTAYALWTNQPDIFRRDANKVSLVTDKQGPFAFGIYYDNIPPEIRAFVGGKEILFLDYAAKNKPFNIFITDSSGIDTASIMLLLNRIPLAGNYRSEATSSGNPSTVILTAYPYQITRVDSLTVIAKDNAGNRAEKVFVYRPGEKLKIKFFSCHPNPFTAKPGKIIRFPFLLTDVATRVTLTIYTISGRRVWQWKNSSELIGYQEVTWDGTTLNRRSQGEGYRIANGTYYAKLVARNKHRNVQKIIRIAKLEGY